MLGNWFNSMRPRIQVEVKPDGITFAGQEEITLAPAVRVADDGKFIAIGQEAYRASEGRLIEFPAEAFPAQGNWPHESAFVGFCRYGLLSTMENTVIKLKPIVQITDVGAVNRVFGRNGAVVLEHALRMAGAAAVEFISPAV